MSILDTLPDNALFTILRYSYPEGFQVCKKFTQLLRRCRLILDTNKAIRLNLSTLSIENAIFGSTRIKCLIIGGWADWSNLHISKLVQTGQFRTIRFISLRGCSKITSKALAILLEKISFNVVGIDLFNCPYIDATALFSILLFHNLKTLSLGSSFKSLLDNEALEKLFPSLNPTQTKLNTKIQLKRLDLVGCKAITDLSSLNRPYLANLEYLDLTGTSATTCLENLTNLTNLKHLIMPGLDVDPSTLYNCIKDMKFLETLDISGSTVNHTCITAILNNNNLNAIKLSKCSGFDNICLRKIITTLPKLSIIDVSKCWKLTESFIANSPVKSGNALTQFGIFQCSLDAANVKMLLAKAGAINEINIAKPIDFKKECKDNQTKSEKRKRYTL